MAGNILDNGLGFVDVRQVSKGGTTTAAVGTPANYASLAAMKARLAAVNGAYFTTAKLNQMSYNDHIFALRLADDPGSFK